MKECKCRMQDAQTYQGIVTTCLSQRSLLALLSAYQAPVLVVADRGRLRNQRSSSNWICLSPRWFGIPTQRAAARMESQSLSRSTNIHHASHYDPPCCRWPPRLKGLTFLARGCRNIPDGPPSLLSHHRRHTTTVA